MYSTVQQGSLRLSSECCGCIWPAWVGSYWPFIIFYCRGSPIVSRIMGQGHVCVSSSDVLTTHQMTDMLELVTSEHLLKYSVKITCWVAQHQAVMSFCKIQLQQWGGEQPPISNLYRLVSDSKPWAHFQLFKLYCSDKSNSDSWGYLVTSFHTRETMTSLVSLQPFIGLLYFPRHRDRITGLHFLYLEQYQASKVTV